MKFKNGATTDLCLLCSALLDLRIGSFIAEYNALSSVRQSYISSLVSILAVNKSLLTVKPVINNTFLVRQWILDCTSVTITSRVLLCPEACHRVETVSRHLCIALHLKNCVT